MSKKWRIPLLKYGISVAVSLAFAGVYLAGQGNLRELTQEHLFRVLSDAFFVPGFLAVAFGALIALANEGSLDAVSFILSRAVRMLIPMARLGERETYGEYVARRREKKVHGFGFLFIVGGIFLAVGAVFMLLYQYAHG